MKISIEVDLEPHEFDLANELLRTLNQLTEHVTVRRKVGAAAISSSSVSKPSAPTSGSVVAVPVAAPVAVPAAPAAPPAPATPQDARRVFTQLLARLADGTQLDAVAPELARVFGSSPLPPPSLLEEFLESFYATAFDPGNIAAEQSVAPFMHVLPRLPDGVKGDAKSKVIAKVLTHLNQKRPLSTGREEFYLQAEAFSVLSEMGFVGIDGAVQTIEKLLRNAEKRAAAVTTLGKTVERCPERLAGANPALLASLLGVLDGVAEQQFQYDIDWINNNLGRTRPQLPPQPFAAAPPAVPAVPVPAPAAPQPPAPATVANRAALKLAVSTTFTLPAAPPGGIFFALGWDPTSRHLVSGGRELPVTVWGEGGEVQHTIDCPGMYVCCVDVELANQLVLLCGIYEDPLDACKSRISIYDGRPGQAFALRGNIMRQEVDMTAVVRALPNTPNLVTGESIRLPGDAYQEQIALYDLNRVVAPGSTAAVPPVVVFQEHTNLVTCIAPLGAASPGVFVSGSRDNTVRLWDARAGTRAVATLGVPAGEATHAEMVTCVDVSADASLVVSGSLDMTVAAWDLRATGGYARPLSVAGASTTVQHHNAPWVNHGVLKVSLDGSPVDRLAAVATVAGLYTVDFSAPAAPLVTAADAFMPEGGKPRQYNDTKWARGAKGTRLYASAGDAVSIDVLDLQGLA